TIGMFKSNKINSGSLSFSRLLKNSRASCPLGKQCTVSEIWVISMSFLTLKIVIGSSSIRHRALIVLIKIDFKFRALIYRAFHFDFSFHGLNLVFGYKKTDPSCISVSMEGLVHPK